MIDAEWMLDAACNGIADPDLFHDPARYPQAKRLCSTCPVQVECLTWAIEHVESGLWAGTTEQERYGGKRAIHLALREGGSRC